MDTQEKLDKIVIERYNIQDKYNTLCRKRDEWTNEQVQEFKKTLQPVIDERFNTELEKIKKEVRDKKEEEDQLEFEINEAKSLSNLPYPLGTKLCCFDKTTGVLQIFQRHDSYNKLRASPIPGTLVVREFKKDGSLGKNVYPVTNEEAWKPINS
jgi:seryl-tRNA synthetase